jgi:hypothetical protein
MNQARSTLGKRRRLADLLQAAIISPQAGLCGTQIKPVSPYKRYQIAAIELREVADIGPPVLVLKIITLFNCHGY